MAESVDFPDWPKWRQMRLVRLWEAVALSCNIEPRSLPPDAKETVPQFAERLEVALKNRSTPEFPWAFERLRADGDERSRVRVVEFVGWAIGMGRSLPDELGGSRNWYPGN